ncbi:MAG: hypothetical protein SGBAC_003060 [Bacillariaceae sp.]
MKFYALALSSRRRLLAFLGALGLITLGVEGEATSLDPLFVVGALFPLFFPLPFTFGAFAPGVTGVEAAVGTTTGTATGTDTGTAATGTATGTAATGTATGAATDTELEKKTEGSLPRL